MEDACEPMRNRIIPNLLANKDLPFRRMMLTIAGCEPDNNRISETDESIGITVKCATEYNCGCAYTIGYMHNNNLIVAFNHNTNNLFIHGSKIALFSYNTNLLAKLDDYMNKGKLSKGSIYYYARGWRFTQCSELTFANLLPVTNKSANKLAC